MFQAAVPIPEEQIRRAVTDAFRAHDLARQSLSQRFWAWVYSLWLRVWEMVRNAFDAVHVSKPITTIIILLLAVATFAVIARLTWVWRSKSGSVSPGGWGPGGVFRAGDPWALAQSLAAAGSYTEAAHALYGALLEAAARAQQVRLHPSKTAGDYARELRARESKIFPRFRAFAGTYEVVIYGQQSCDRERYDRLFELAVPMLRPNG